MSKELDDLLDTAVGATQQNESFDKNHPLAYTNPNTLPFKPDTYIPYRELVSAGLNKLADYPKEGGQTFGESGWGGPILGFGQGAANTIGSMLNVPLGWFNAYTDPVDVSYKLSREPGLEGNVNRYGFQLGDVLGSIGPELAAYWGTGGLTRGITGIPGTVARTAKGAGIGYAGNQYGLGGRELGAVLGGLGSLGVESSNKAIAKRLATQKENEIAKLRPEYNELLPKANPVDYPYLSDTAWDVLRGKGELKLPPSLQEQIIEYELHGDATLAKKIMASLKKQREALKTPIEPELAAMTGERRIKYEKLNDYINEIQGEINRGFQKAGYPQGVGELAELDKQWKSKVEPYNFKELSNYMKGYATSPEPVLEAVDKMRNFAEKLPYGAANEYQYLMRRNPEIYINKYLPSFTPKTAWGIGGGLIGYPFIRDLLSSKFGGEQE